MVRRISGVSKGEHSTGPVVQSTLLFSSIFPSDSSLDRCLKKTASTWLATLTVPFLSVHQKAVFFHFQLSKSQEDRIGDCRANPQVPGMIEL